MLYREHSYREEGFNLSMKVTLNINLIELSQPEPCFVANVDMETLDDIMPKMRYKKTEASAALIKTFLCCFPESGLPTVTV